MTTSSRPFLIAAIVLGLLFFTGLSLAEGAFIAATERAAPWWALPLNVGVAAPVSLVLSLVGAGVALSWWRLLGAPEWTALRDRIRGWFSVDDLHVASRRSAWIMTTALLALMWFGGGVLLGKKVLSSVQTPAFAVALVLIIQVASGALLVALGAVVAWPLALLLERLGRRPRGANLVQPWVVCASLMGMALLALGGLLALKYDVMKLLPWAYVIGPLMGFILAALMGGVLTRTRRQTVVALVCLCGLQVGLGAFALWLPDTLSGARQLFIDRATVAGTWIGWLEPKLDADGDGASAYYAGGDCAPQDPEIGPNQVEIMDNGVDEDCDGEDFSLEEGRYVTGPRHHRRPKGMVAKPHILLVTTDALSFQETSLSPRNTRDTTPALKAFAKRATTFEAAFSAGPSTRLAIPALLAGKFNATVSLSDRSRPPYPYAKNVKTVASLLRQKGYRTVFIPGARWMNVWPYPGFSTIEPVYKTAADKGHTAPEVTAAALRHIEADSDKPLFLWVHYFDHHSPYEVPSGAKVFEGERELDRYHNELRYTDRHWGRLFAAVEARWTPEQYVLFFSSDHGEAFDANHTLKHHGKGLYTQELHVPLVIQTPQRRGDRVSGLVSHLDVGPTVGSLVGFDTSRLEGGRWLGESLVPVLFDGVPVQKGVVFALNYIPEERKRGKEPFHDISVRTDELVLTWELRRNSARLTRWRDDPLDLEDVGGTQPRQRAIHRYLGSERLRWLRDHERGLLSAITSKKKKKAVPPNKKRPSSPLKSTAPLNKKPGAANKKPEAPSKTAPASKKTRPGKLLLKGLAPKASASKSVQPPPKPSKVPSGRAPNKKARGAAGAKR